MAEGSANQVEVFRASTLEGIAHGFLGRAGGVSLGEVAGLNAGLGSDDDPVAVAENRRLAVRSVAPGATLVSVYQVHSGDCVTVADPWSDDERPRADALVTARAGLVLGILTADCAPVLLADREAGVIGAAHAGWKGAIGGVVEATISAMELLGAQREGIAAAVGPCIAQDSYEVDEVFRDRFLREDASSVRHFRAGAPGHWHFDLESYVVSRLTAAGITRAQGLALDTYANEERFFSYRRACHRNEASYGRQISLISLS